MLAMGGGKGNWGVGCEIGLVDGWVSKYVREIQNVEYEKRWMRWKPQPSV